MLLRRLVLMTLVTAVVLASAGLGSWLAWNHPLWPGVLFAGFVAWGLAVACWPRLWFFVVPAALPLLNLSPWSGWLVFEEFDILLLGVLAGGYGRLAVLACGRGVRAQLDGPSRHQEARLAPPDWALGSLALCLAASGLLALWRGVADAGGWSFGWFDGYTAALNSVRVFKSLAYALLLAPLIRGAMRRDAERSAQLLGSGVLAGLAVVSVAVLWERYAFPGLFDFTSRYRTTALFWEMHVGGAAIDGFLAMTLPLLLWALAVARRPAVWAALALLTVAAVYAVLTTFSRGVYLAVALPCVGLAAGWWLRQARSGSVGLLQSVLGQVRWKRVGSALLAGVLLMEVGSVLMGGTYMGERMGVADRDMDRRLAHWRHGLALLTTPADWFFGIGLGRLPAHYARQVVGGEFSGTVTWQQERCAGPPPSKLAPQCAARRYSSEPDPSPLARQGSVTGFARLAGPAKDASLAGWFGLARRVELTEAGGYRVSLDLRADADTWIAVRVCERHLLFDGACQHGQFRTGATAGEWRRQSLTLVGVPPRRGAWFAPRLGVLSVSVLQAGASVDLANISLGAPRALESATVGDFSRGLSHWFPAAQVHFLPWHIDNLYLELLIERGLLGLLLAGLALAAALRRGIYAGGAGGQTSQLSDALAAGVAGGLLVGIWGSVMDVPRVAFLLFLLITCLIEWPRGTDLR